MLLGIILVIFLTFDILIYRMLLYEIITIEYIIKVYILYKSNLYIYIKFNY